MILRLKTRESRSLPGLPITSSPLPFSKTPALVRGGGFCLSGLWELELGLCRWPWRWFAIGVIRPPVFPFHPGFRLFFAEEWALRSTIRAVGGRLGSFPYDPSRITASPLHGLPVRKIHWCVLGRSKRSRVSRMGGRRRAASQNLVPASRVTFAPSHPAGAAG